VPVVHIGFPVYLPGPLYGLLRRLRPQHARGGGNARNLRGDRDVEWGFVAAALPEGPGTAIDFGPGQSPLGLMAAQRGFDVAAVDREPVHWDYEHPRLRYVRSDLLELDWRDGPVDLVINCSTVEHVGLPGRYGVVRSVPDGDLQAMARLRGLMKPGGTMLLTLPVGQDGVFPPLCRVYGEQRLPRLLAGFRVEREAFWIKDAANRWVQTDSARALAERASAGSHDPLRNLYALGCFVLRC
jgi:SAM-dependent methyltransferase